MQRAGPAAAGLTAHGSGRTPPGPSGKRPQERRRRVESAYPVSRLRGLAIWALWVALRAVRRAGRFGPMPGAANRPSVRSSTSTPLAPTRVGHTRAVDVDGGRSRFRPAGNAGHVTYLLHGDMAPWFPAGLCWRLTALVPHCGCTEYALPVHWNRRVSLMESQIREGRDARRVVRKGVMPHDEQPQ